jgi:hypothetical protein
MLGWGGTELQAEHGHLLSIALQRCTCTAQCSTAQHSTVQAGRTFALAGWMVHIEGGMGDPGSSS